MDESSRFCIFGGMIRASFAILVLAALLPSCGAVRNKVEAVAKADADEELPFGPTGIPPHLRANRGAGTPITPGGNAAPVLSNLTPEEDIVYTDPDNPEASLIELADILAAPPPEAGSWESDPAAARRRSMREGKPLLIWFTHSKNSPMCKALSQELFSTREFEDWASERFVRLRVDANFSQRDPNLSFEEQAHRDTIRKHAVDDLKKRYKVLGHPFLVVLKPNGEVAGKYRGYKRGDAEFRWGQLKHAAIAASHAYGNWRAEMEEKGYREWSDREGRRIFAKLISYKDGVLILVEPDGTRARTKENVLSTADRAWIAEQKRLRGIQ